MILGFQDRFVSYVLDGSKRHTIRSGARWRAGMRADLYERPRQRDMRLLFRAPVVRVEFITIWLRRPSARLDKDDQVFAGALGIAVGDQILTDEEANSLAYVDGFRGFSLVRNGPLNALAEMAQFWIASHGVAGNMQPFRGQLIHWNYDLRTS